MNQVAPAFEARLEETLPHIKRHKEAVLGAHVIADEGEVNGIVRHREIAFHDLGLDSLDAVEDGLDQFGTEDQVHHGLFEAAELAVDFEEGDPRADDAEVPVGLLARWVAPA